MIEKASVYCPHCKAAVSTAQCCESWCADCHRSKWQPTSELLYCQGHRIEVRRDQHCSKWETDK